VLYFKPGDLKRTPVDRLPGLFFREICGMHGIAAVETFLPTVINLRESDSERISMVSTGVVGAWKTVR
jgi:hypothetical protein